MNESTPSPTCSHCGTPLPEGVPESQCPRCLLAQVLEPTQAGDETAPAAPPTPEELAPHFPHLEILECLGRGGMGVVYKARQRSLNRLVALKLLAPERADDPAFAARFENEARALAALSHPHIVGVHDFGKAGGYYYLLMEFVDGMNLRQVLQNKRLTPKEALSIVPPVCDAFQCPHDQGLVHRDIKPENLLIDRHGVVKIADFGIAKIVRDAPDRIANSEGEPIEGTISLPLGTPDYAAPEQANGTADHRADIYSLGVVLYEMLTGERPADKIEAPSKRVQVDLRIDEIVLRALEREPELRFATAAEFRTRVEAVAGTRRSEAGRPPFQTSEATGARPWVMAAAALTLFYAGVGFLSLLGALRVGVIEALIVLAIVGAILWKTGLLPRLSPADFRRGLSWTAFALSLPVIGLAVFFVLGMSGESGGWNPRPMEAVAVPLVWIGAVLLPLAGVTLRQASRAESKPASRSDRLRAIGIALALVLGFAGLASAYWLLARAESHTVDMSVAQGSTRGGTLLLDLHLHPSQGACKAAIEFTGPAGAPETMPPPPVASGDGFDSIRPGEPMELHSRLLTEFDLWRVGFVFPSEDLAEEALLHLRPVGPLTLHGPHRQAAVLFEVPDKTGRVYRASLLISRPDHAAPQGAGNGGNPSVIEPVKVEADPTTRSTERTFTLRHVPASDMAEHLRKVLPAKPGHEAKPSASNVELTVTAPPEVMTRVQTFLTVMDWPDSIGRMASYEYPRENAMRAARSFFYACAVDDSPEAIAKLLSLGALSRLRGDELTDEELKDYYNPAWEKSLRGKWPGRDEAIQRMVGEWNRFPLTRLAEQPEVAGGIYRKHLVRATFEGAPEDFYDLMIQPVRQTAKDADGAYEFASLPPWEKRDTAPKPTKRAATQPGTFPVKPGLTLVIAERPRGQLDRAPIVEAQLVWQEPDEAGPSDTYDIRLSEGMPYAIGWREDGEVFWVRCSAKMGSGEDERVNHYLRVLTVRGPGDVEETMTDLEDPPADVPEDLLPALRERGAATNRPVPIEAVEPARTAHANIKQLADAGQVAKSQVIEAEAELRQAQGNPGAGPPSLPASLPATNPLPDFWAENAGGQIVRLGDKGVRGRWVLVEFWSLSDRERIETEQSLQRLRRKFEDDDRLLIWSVCVEDERDAWLEEISARPDLANADGSTKKFRSDPRWWQLILGWQSDAQWRAFLVSCGLSELPQYFLIHPEGKLVGRLEPAELGETLSRHLAE